jgi:hypothetical protein
LVTTCPALSITNPEPLAVVSWGPKKGLSEETCVAITWTTPRAERA